MTHDAFIDPATGKPYNFTPELVTSGVSVGVPGTPATWQRGARPLGHAVAGRRRCEPAAALARRGFVVDKTFNAADRRERASGSRPSPRPASSSCRHGKRARRSAASSATRELADTYDLLGRRGHGRVLPRRARRRDRPTRSASRRRRGRTDLPVPEGQDAAPRTSQRYARRSSTGRPTSATAGSTSTACRRRRRRHPRSARRSTSSSATTSASLTPRPGAAPLPRGERTSPSPTAAQYVGDPRRSTCPLERRCSPTRTPPSGPARSTRATRSRRRSRPATSRRPTAAAPRRPARARPTPRHRERQHHQPHRRRQGRQRRRVHAHHRADRRLRDRAARPRLPAQQRADRLQPRSTTRPTPTGSSPASGRAARCRRRSCCRNGKPVARGRLARRLDDHHHGARRSWSTGSTSGCRLPQAIAAPRAAPAQHGDRSAPSRPSSTSTAPRSTALGHTFAPAGDARSPAPPRSARRPAIEFGPDGLLTVAAEPTRRGGGAAGVVHRR